MRNSQASRNELSSINIGKSSMQIDWTFDLLFSQYSNNPILDWVDYVGINQKSYFSLAAQFLSCCLGTLHSRFWKSRFRSFLLSGVWQIDNMLSASSHIVNRVLIDYSWFYFERSILIVLLACQKDKVRAKTPWVKLFTVPAEAKLGSSTNVVQFIFDLNGLEILDIDVLFF